MAYVLFISELKLKESTAVNLSVDVDILLPFVREAQKLYVETALGSDLTQKLKDEYETELKVGCVSLFSYTLHTLFSQIYIFIYLYTLNISQINMKIHLGI